MMKERTKPMDEAERDEAEKRPEGAISRRKLLASLGAAGVALAAGGVWNGRSSGAAYAKSVSEDVYGALGDKLQLKDLRGLDFCLAVSLDGLRATGDRLPDAVYYVTDAGKEGVFVYDKTDSTSADDTGTVVVTTGGRRFKRVVGDTVVLSWFGAVGDGVTVETLPMQAALNAASGKRLYIPKQRSGFYLTGQLFVPSDIVIEFEPGTVVQAVDTLKRTAPYERLIRVKNARNVHIIGNGATLRMNKAAYTSGEQAHIFDISGSENVVIERIHANDSGGDGFYIGNYEASMPFCKQIVLRHCVADNNRRQGLSIISADGFLAEGCRFTNTNGTAPKSGVDIEPNNNSGQDVLKQIRFVDCVAEGNAGRGFLVSLHRMKASNERVDITFRNCRTKGNSFGSSVNYGAEGAQAVKGEVTFVDCAAEQEQYAGYSVLSSSPESVKTSFVRCRAVNCNTVNAPQDPYGFGSSFIVTTVPQFPRTAIGNVEFVECVSVDERAVPLIARGFALKKNANEAIRDVRFVNCTVRGGAQRLLYVDPAADRVYADLRPQPELAAVSSGAVEAGSIGHRIANEGAAGAVTLTLPPARTGRVHTFAVESPHPLTVATAPGSVIRTPNGSLPAVESANPGDSITLTGRADGNWDVAGAVGAWFGPATAGRQASR
ncbi:right-handed parallel beta-helix repeat-containing protein [Paenibacillus flagellatus]|uniref:Right handed beta helix domain-containing protein n=1 Tax=Paenibacillus flagellatus TaxID=2211139 RepID=A0A2V5KX44_9BACL|nr:right-handed parallel beta-helix repeat-containing protein [Paenibacillus flagellatus]PYI56907.1 hypothetical protein DLM86_00185 [Paenibacillus flagellatus]